MKGIASYRQARANVSPEHLVLLLLRESVTRLSRLEQADPKTWIGDLHHVRSILLALMEALDPTADEALVGRLADLYGWGMMELIRAGSEREVEVIRPVRMMLTTLLEGWQHALEQPLAAK